MATYIPQIQDTMEKVNPPQTNWQFESSLLGARQSNYNQGHSKLKKLYGDLLNKGLTREGNIKSREEFFKSIDQDLRKIAGVDLSIDSNVSQAQQVFNQIYDNDVLVKDMVWTDQFQKEMQRAESFRGCTDPSKCGGEFWEDGIKAMNYQREEYKNMGDQESLGAQPARYVPYNNMMEKALKYAKEADLSVTIDELSGRYIYRTKNGANLVSPLTDMFQQLFEHNPQLHDMYKVQSYNARKDWTYQAFQSGKFESLDQASAAYVEMRGKEIIEASRVVSRGVDMDVSAIDTRLKALKKDFDKGVFTEADTKKVQEFKQLQGMLVNAQTAQQYTDLIKSAEKNMHNQTNMNAIGNVLDDAMAIGIFNQDLNVAANTLAHKDMEVTMTADAFALADQAYAHDIAKENNRQKNRLELEGYKSKLAGATNTDPNAIVYMMDYEQKKSKADSFKVGEYLMNNLGADIYSGMGSDLSEMSESDIRKFLNTTDDSNKGAIKAKFEAALNARTIAQQDANEAAIKAHKHGNDVGDTEFFWNQFTPEIWESFEENISPEQRATIEIPLGVQAMGAGDPLLFQYPGSDNLYYKKDGSWYRGAIGKKITDYVKIKTRSSIDNLESNSSIYNPEF